MAVKVMVYIVFLLDQISKETLLCWPNLAHEGWQFNTSLLFLNISTPFRNFRVILFEVLYETDHI